MTKYRIVKFDNGKFGVQERAGLMGWHTKFEEYNTIKEAQDRINYSVDFDKEWEDRKKRKVAEVIE